jgi:nucleotidyltransferase substrate binding protein (TIGR01987 family)
MTAERIKELHSDYVKAFTKLKEALKEDIAKGSIILDGTIQRFEFTFELAWKLMKGVLALQGIDAATPRQVIKEAFKAGIITDGEGWILMLEDRNITSHIYDESQALMIYRKIKDRHYPNLEKLGKDSLKFS